MKDVNCTTCKHCKYDSKKLDHAWYCLQGTLGERVDCTKAVITGEKFQCDSYLHWSKG